MSMLHVLIIRVHIGVVIFEPVILQHGRSVVQAQIVRVDIGLRSYDTPVWGDLCGEISGYTPGCQRGHSRGDLLSYATSVWEVIGSFLSYKSGYRKGDL